MMNRIIVGDCCWECFRDVTERDRSKSGGRHEGKDEKWEGYYFYKICFFIYTVLVGCHDVFHFRDQLSMNNEFVEDNGWVGIYCNDRFQNWFEGYLRMELFDWFGNNEE